MRTAPGSGGAPVQDDCVAAPALARRRYLRWIPYRRVFCRMCVPMYASSSQPLSTYEEHDPRPLLRRPGQATPLLGALLVPLPVADPSPGILARGACIAGVRLYAACSVRVPRRRQKTKYRSTSLTCAWADPRTNVPVPVLPAWIYSWYRPRV